MGFKKFVAGLTFLAAAALAGNNPERESRIGMRLARPGLTKQNSTFGTQEACKANPHQLVNNVCLETNHNAIRTAISQGFTCYSVETSDGKTRSTCEEAESKCHTEDVKTEPLKMLVEHHPVSIHSCSNKPPENEVRPNT